LEAVQKAEELRPALILLDIGLPKLNGIETARRIRKLVPESKILFLSLESDADIVHETVSLGISGYAVKISAREELLTAVEAILQGDRFISSGLAGRVRERVRNNVDLHFEFDPENKIFLAKFHGSVTSESIKSCYRVAAVALLVADDDFRGSIADFSDAAGFDVTPLAIRELAALSPADPVVSRPRVIVAPSALVFALARLFQAIGKATRPNLHVVRNLPQAFALLEVTTPRFQPIK
jgi:CheY-like chemotaxis protein